MEEGPPSAKERALRKENAPAPATRCRERSGRREFPPRPKPAATRTSRQVCGQKLMSSPPAGTSRLVTFADVPRQIRPACCCACCSSSGRNSRKTQSQHRRAHGGAQTVWALARKISCRAFSRVTRLATHARIVPSQSSLPAGNIVACHSATRCRSSCTQRHAAAVTPAKESRRAKVFARRDRNHCPDIAHAFGVAPSQRAEAGAITRPHAAIFAVTDRDVLAHLAADERLADRRLERDHRVAEMLLAVTEDPVRARPEPLVMATSVPGPTTPSRRRRPRRTARA